MRGIKAKALRRFAMGVAGTQTRVTDTPKQYKEIEHQKVVFDHITMKLTVQARLERRINSPVHIAYANVKKRVKS